MELILIVAFLASLVAIAGILYPFKPFGKRRYALFTLIACFVVIGITAPPPKSEERNTESTANPSLVAPQRDIATQEPIEVEKIETKEDVEAEKRSRLEEKIRESVESLQWSKARNRFRTLIISDLATDEFKDEIEARMLELVKPLPASKRESNLKGYQFLAAIRPKNAQYGAKIKSYEAAITTARQRAVTLLRQDEDRVEGITWYKHPNQPRYLNSRSTAYLYIGRKGAVGRPWLRMKVQYTSSSWLFVKRVIAWHDGIKEPLISGSFERDNNSKIWEWMDVSPSDNQIEVLRSLGNAKEAILRFEGDQYRKDVKLSAGDKRAIREVLAAYEVMRSGL
ncbi:hypothetical protein [Pseudophaeobacter sp.]|uniref:hypothetical protein n=1 Tax=Pseudophaeobacter sp. TaxID=1971739 RepID=UPI003298DF7D